MEDLAKTRSFLVAPHEPGSMCTESSHMLLYIDEKRVTGNVYEIRWCTTAAPVPLTWTKSTKVKQSAIKDMCIVQDKDKTLIVIADDYEGIFAFDSETGELDWRSDEWEDWEGDEMYARSVTADNRGHLFVCDTNNDCIQVFTTMDGEYQGVAFKEGEQGLGEPKRIRWCQTLSSLIIAHQENDSKCSISIVKLS